MLTAKEAYNIALKNKNSPDSLEICLKHIEDCANHGNFSTNYYTPEYYNYLSDADILTLNNLGYKVSIHDGGN